MRANQAYIVELCIDANFGQPFIPEVKPAPKFASLVCFTFTPFSYSSHFLDAGDVSPALYESFRQLGRGTIPIEGPAVPAAYLQILVHYSFALMVIIKSS